MRHRVDKNKLTSDKGHQRALLKNLSASLIEHEKIETTFAKAKSLRPYIERLVTKAKKGSDYNTLRYLRTKLFSEDAIRKLVTDIAPNYNEVKGGYTRIVKVRNRDGDNSVMAYIEFVNLTKKTPAKSEKTKQKTAITEETKNEEKTELKGTDTKVKTPKKETKEVSTKKTKPAKTKAKKPISKKDIKNEK